MSSYPQAGGQHASVLDIRAISVANSTDSTDQHGSNFDIRAVSDLRKQANSTDSTLFPKTGALRARQATWENALTRPLHTPTKKGIQKYPCCRAVERMFPAFIHNRGDIR